MKQIDFEKLHLEISVKAKNGIDFIISASLIWFVISFVWTLKLSSYDKSVLTFIVGGLMLPLAFLMSKLLKTQWKISENPLQPLGLWLNFAQIFYFPFLIFIMIRFPDYFLMTYAIITGAHLFPYAWYYKVGSYAFCAGIISIGALFFGLFMPIEKMYLIGVFMGFMLTILANMIYASLLNKRILYFR